MKYLRQFFIIVAICLVGEFLKNMIPLPIPTSIHGLVILLLALQFKLIKLSSVKEVSTFLIEIMPVMFIPPAAGLIGIWPVLAPVFWAFAAITILSTIIVMAVSGLVTQAVRRWEDKS